MVRSKGGKRVQFLLHLFMMLMAACAILPILLVFIGSVTEEKTLLAKGYSFFPERYSLAGYAYLWEYRDRLFSAYITSFGITAVGTVCHLLIAALLAFPLTFRNLPGRRFLSAAVLFSAMFSAGLIPQYYIWTNCFHLKNTLAGYLLPNLLLNGISVFLVKKYLETAALGELTDAAETDGLGYWGMFVHIVLPTAKPVLALAAVFAGLRYWNDWFNGACYMTTYGGQPSLPILLQWLSQNIYFLEEDMYGACREGVPMVPRYSVWMASAVLAITPVLPVYPLILRLLVSGLTLGIRKK